MNPKLLLLQMQFQYWLSVSQLYSLLAKDNEGYFRLADDALNRANNLIDQFEKEIEVLGIQGIG